jgi:hypothetical protein
MGEEMRRQQIGFVAGIVLTLVSAAGVIGWAQGGDTPIVISDGSLTMQSAVPWTQFTGSGDRKSHPNAAGAITNVVVTIAGKDQTIACSGQPCTVDVMYAGTDIQVASGAGGKGLSVSPFSAFQAGNTANLLAHKNQTAKISHVTVTKSGAKVLDSAASGGGTKVVIGYR